MSSINYDNAREALERAFREAEQAHMGGAAPSVPAKLREAYDTIFASSTQAYREVLLGCIAARLEDRSIDVRLPYMSQGDNAYSGRTLDERVVNPFLREKHIPSSRGPFLSVFRRSVRFDASIREGLRDKAGFDALLDAIDMLKAAAHRDVRKMLGYHLYRFIQLREESHIDLAKVLRLSLEQCNVLISDLLETSSGGRFPVFMIVACFRAIKQVFALDWEIDYQGINVADVASGAGGDISVKQNGQVVLAAEITERRVDKEKVIAIFDTKIAPGAIEDYLFFIKDRADATAAMDQARRYFSQGHEVNFLEIRNWIVTMLSVIGASGRRLFIQEVYSFLDATDVPKALKIAWNDTVAKICSGGP